MVLLTNGVGTLAVADTAMLGEQFSVFDVRAPEALRAWTTEREIRPRPADRAG